MAKSRVVTEAMIDQALELLHKRIAEPPLGSAKSYTRRDAFNKLKSRAKEALAAGHSLETILDDLKGVGIGMTLSTARQYMKPGRKNKRTQSAYTPPEPTGTNNRTVAKVPEPPSERRTAAGGTFAVTEDEREI